MKISFSKYRQNREKRQRLAHIIAAFIILINALDKYESGNSNYLLFGIAGLVFLIFAIVHSRIEHKVPWLDGVFFVIEGILSLLIAYDYYSMGKKALPLCLFAVGIFQLVLAYVKTKKAYHKRKGLG